MNSLRYKLVTFDATNTLLKLTASPGVKYAEVASMFGIDCNKQALSDAFKPNFDKQTTLHPNFGKKSGLGWENWWRQVVRGTFRDANCNAPDEKLDIVVSQLLDIYKTPLCWQATEGAYGLLSYLIYRKVPVGIISNFDPRLHDILKNMKMRHYFTFVLTSYETGIEKPNYKIFREAMSRSGVISLKPEECLHIGDCVMADYYAAMNNKWKGLLVRRDKMKFREEHPTINPMDVFPTLYDLLKHMVNENRPKVIFRGPRTSKIKKDVQ